MNRQILPMKDRRAPKPDLKFNEAAFKHSFLETSTFTVLFAKHRLDYLKSIEAFIRKACEQKKVKYTVNYDECTMEVSTTEATRDPYIIIKADEFIQLLSRGMRMEDAVKILEDDMFSEIMPMKAFCSSEKTIQNRKERLTNPKIMRAIELLTKCSVYVAGKAVCLVGSCRGLVEAKEIIIGCFENVHPVFTIKKLMIKKDLQKKGVEGDWERFMPTIKKTHSKHRKPGRATGNMPEEIKPRKEDIMRETGEYYLEKSNIVADKKREERREKSRQARDKLRMEESNAI